MCPVQIIAERRIVPDLGIFAFADKHAEPEPPRLRLHLRRDAERVARNAREEVFVRRRDLQILFGIKGRLRGNAVQRGDRRLLQHPDRARLPADRALRLFEGIADGEGEPAVPDGAVVCLCARIGSYRLPAREPDVLIHGRLIPGLPRKPAQPDDLPVVLAPFIVDIKGLRGV